MEVISTKVSQVLLMRFDEVPLVRMTQTKHLQGLSELLKFGEANIAQDLEGAVIVVAEHGMLESPDGEYPIRRLILEERRIQLVELDADSTIANQAMDSLRSYLAQVAERPSAGFLQPIVTAEESMVVVKMQFPFGALLSPVLERFIENDMKEAASSEIADAELNPIQVSYRVDYHVTDKSLSDYRISLSRKKFSLEPRKGYPLSERVYFSRAPLSTEKHLDLLESLEAGLVSSPQLAA